MVHACIMNWATNSYVSRSLFGISTDGEAKSKYVHGQSSFYIFNSVQNYIEQTIYF